MSEPIRTSPSQREKLAAALKRNMARRKGVFRQLPSVGGSANQIDPLRVSSACNEQGGTTAWKGEGTPPKNA